MSSVSSLGAGEGPATVTATSNAGSSPSEDLLNSLPAELDDLQPSKPASGSPIEASSPPLGSLDGLSTGSTSTNGTSTFNLQAHGNIPASVSMSALNGAAPAPASGWAGLEGMQRSASASWQASPADGILQSSQPFMGAGGPGQQPSLDGVLPRVASVPLVQAQGQGMQSQLGGHARSLSVPPQGLQASLANLTPAQQQILQQHLLMQQQQQQQQKLGGIGAPNGYNNNHATNLQAAAQAAALRQQSILRQAQAQASSQAQQHAKSNTLLLQQALLGQNNNASLLQQQQQQQQNNAALLNAMASQRGLGMQQQPQQQQQPQYGGYQNSAPLRQQQPLGGSNGRMTPGLASALLSGQLQNNAAAIQALQAQQNLQNAQQQLLLSQALRGNTMHQQQQQQQGYAGQQRSASQLQSEALIAMQRQNSGTLGAGPGIRHNGAGGAGTGVQLGGMSQDQLTAMAQLGLLGKAGGGNSNLTSLMAAGGLTAQQQSALLNALQANGQLKGGMNMNLSGGGMPSMQQQQQQFGGGGGMRPSIGAHGLGGAGGGNNQQSLLAAALAAQHQQKHQQQQQHQQQQMQHMGMRPGGGGGAGSVGLSGQQQQQHPGMLGVGVGGMNTPSLAQMGANAAAGMRANDGVDPIQTLQDIGRTLSQLGITVEAAVNAGLLGGLSASDVRIVAEAHRLDVEARNAAGSGGGAGGATQTAAAGSSGSISGASLGGLGALGGALGGGPGQNGSLSAAFGSGMTISRSVDGRLSAPNPSSPTNSIGAASTSSAPAHPGLAPSGGSLGTNTNGGHYAASAPASTADEDEVDRLLLEIEEEGAGRHARVDEAAIKAKMEDSAAAFDASQYGFFGALGGGHARSAGSADDTGTGAGGGLLGSIEMDGDRPGSAANAHSSGQWAGGLLSSEFDGKLSLGGDPVGGGGGGGSPGSKEIASSASVSEAATSLWGNAQGERTDAFGNYLAGLRLGTGF